jgi:N-acetylglucosaminyldiphosphoundecaprenol N-acetyl-beta-D-mannosaminyltransferase
MGEFHVFRILFPEAESKVFEGGVIVSAPTMVHFGSQHAFESYTIAGVRVDSVTFAETLDAIQSFLADNRLHRISTPNVDHILLAQRNSAFRDAVNSSSLSVPDGKWLLRGARLLNVYFRESVAGRLLVEPMLKLAGEREKSVYILASKGSIAERAARNLQIKYPNLRIAGAHSPSLHFGEDPSETEQIIETLNRTKPDILFLGMGAPKSEIWLHQNEARIPAKVAIGVGYAFDIIAGEIRECPRWLTRIGFEWAYRLCREPKRLWKRYLVRDPQFFFLMLRERRRLKSRPA